jgi:hypothetical protein
MEKGGGSGGQRRRLPRRSDPGREAREVEARLYAVGPGGVLQVVRPLPKGIRAPLEICSFDSDAHGDDFRTGRVMLLNTLRQLSVDARVVERADGPSRGTVVLAAFGEPVQGRGSLEVAPVVRDAVMQAYADARAAGRDVLILWFGHPRLAGVFGDEAPVVCAWSGEACMQAAAGRWLARQRG